MSQSPGVIKVAIVGAPNKAVFINPKATIGATLGVDFFAANGTPYTLATLAAALQAQTAAITQTQTLAHRLLAGLTLGDDHPQYVRKDTLTTAGDMYVATGAAAPARFPVGTEREVLTVVNGHLKWAPIPVQVVYGIDGEDGEAGMPGPPGAAGIAGTTGAIGPMGRPGTDGNDGDDGQNGPAGPPGSAGAQGTTGAQGIPGLDGNDGDDGQNGPAGPAGSAGVAGPQGIQGVIGPTGEDGADGDPGFRGAQGIQGITGPTGAAGAQGFVYDASQDVDDGYFPHPFTGTAPTVIAGAWTYTAPIIATASPLTNTVTRALTGLASKLATDATFNNTVLTATNLSLTVNETGTYLFESMLYFYEATIGTGGFQWSIGPGTAVIASGFWSLFGFVNGGSTFTGTFPFATTENFATINTSATNPNWVLIKGIMVVGTAGTIILTGAQNSLLAADITHLVAGSYISLTKIG